MVAFEETKMSTVATYYIKGVGDKLYAYVALEDYERLKVALEKIADPRLRDHKEPDTYTELCCVMNIAAEALE